MFSAKEQMQFNLAKGFLVVDPLEARGIRPSSRHSNIYLLFQINTKVHRSKTVKNDTTLTWKEDSQCRFDIDPGLTPVLRVFIMEATKTLPLLLGKGELNLIDAFYEKKSDKWVKIQPLGQVNVELTFYELAPIMPQKVSKKKEKSLESPVKQTDEVTQKLLSSVDQVFVDHREEERSRLRKIAHRVKRRYKMSMEHKEEYQRRASSSSGIYSGDLLSDELRRSSAIEPHNLNKELPPTPVSSFSGTTSTETPRFGRSMPSSSALNEDLFSLAELDINSLPFSADSVGGHFPSKAQTLKKLEEEKRLAQIKYETLSPEAYALVDRLEKGYVKKEDFQIQGGASEYSGDGTWKKGCLRDSVITGAPPKLPPKIPVGMKPEEYFVTNKNECINYFKKTAMMV